MSTRMTTDINEDCGTTPSNYDFEKKIQERMERTTTTAATLRKQTARKPEEVKFRTMEEERASANLQQR